MEKHLGLRKWQKGIIVTLVAVFTFVGFNTVIDNLQERIVEEVTHEMMLQQRREKIYKMRMKEGQATFDIRLQEIGNVEDGTSEK